MKSEKVRFGESENEKYNVGGWFYSLRVFNFGGTPSKGGAHAKNFRLRYYYLDPCGKVIQSIIIWLLITQSVKIDAALSSGNCLEIT